SRREDCAEMSSTLVMTLTSLSGCAVPCATASPSAATAAVMRERASTFDGPTASDSMLNARRAKRPATRVRTPGTSWTSTERVWRCMLVLLVPIRGHVPGYLNLVVRNTGWNHRPHHGVCRHHEVDDDGTIINFHGLMDGRGDVFFFFDSYADGTVGFSKFHEVWHANRVCAGVQIGVGVPGIVKQGLPLADHAQRRVVDQCNLDRYLVDHTRGQFLVGHLETPVTVNGPHGTVGFSNLCAHGCWNSEAHGPQTGGVHPLIWALVTNKLCAPHLVLAHTCHVDGFWPGNFR